MKAIYKILIVLGLFSASLGAFAQTQPDATVPATPGPNLVAALATAALPPHRVFLTVSAETVALPQESVMPPEKSSLTTVTDAYQRNVRAFGAVTAIAPPTMFVLNPHPANPDLYAGLQPEQAFKMLAASLSDSQWHSLIGEDGLGLSELTDENQRKLLQIIFPSDSLMLWLTDPTADTTNRELDLSNELPQVRLRLGQSVQISLPVKGEPGGSVSAGTDDPFRYRWTPEAVRSDNLYSIPQSALFPNQLKPGQLDWNLAALHVIVPLSGMKTVGDLVSRVSQMTHLELYADKRYEGKSLTILGSVSNSVLASDLLRAVAYCVSGAFRQVGPAYVLTDDVVGVEARRAILIQFKNEASRHLKQLMDSAADILGTRRSLQELAAYDDPLALNPAERKNVSLDNMQPSTGIVELPLSQLTPAQQANVRQQDAGLKNQNSSDPADSVAPDLNGKMGLTVSPKLELLVPSLNNAVAATFSFSDLFDVSAKLAAERAERDTQPISDEPQKAPMPLSQTMALVQHRAVLLQPTSAAELASDITVMKHLGFNELWLNVFSQGHRQTALPDGNDLLTLALHKTRGTGIHVYAVMDLLQWGTDVPSDAVDLDIFGENSAQEEARLQQEEAKEASVNGDDPSIFGPISGLSVTPLNAEVSGQLISLVRNLALRPDLSGIVWRETAPNGYDHDGDPSNRDGDPSDQSKRLDLGYTIAARLAFLRWQHVDPIDISTPPIYIQGEDEEGGWEDDSRVIYGDMPITHIPNFNNEQKDDQLCQAWAKFRRDADVNLMRKLYTTAKGSNSRLSLFVQQRRSENSQDWYGSWTSRTAPLPGWHTPDTEDVNVEDSFAKTQSAIALVALDADDAKNVAELPFALEINIHGRRWNEFAKAYDVASKWDGFVWNIAQLKSDPLH